MTPAEINQRNRRFYKLDAKASFWQRHGFNVLLYTSGMLWAAAIVLRAMPYL